MDIMYSYIKFIDSILGNTVVTESSERLKEALRPFRIYNNSKNYLPLFPSHYMKNKQPKKSSLFTQGHPFLVLPQGKVYEDVYSSTRELLHRATHIRSGYGQEAEENRIWLELLYLSQTRS